MRSKRKIIFLALFAILIINSVYAVDRSKFKTCDQSSFCKRNRATNLEKRESFSIADVKQIGDTKFSANLQHPLFPGRPLGVELRGLEDSIIHLRVSEDNAKRFQGLPELLEDVKEASLSKISKTNDKLTFSLGNNVTAHVSYAPFSIDFEVNGKIVMRTNHKQLFNFEPVIESEDQDPIPKEVVNTEAQKPENWNDEVNEEWVPPKINNPAHEGRWSENFQGHPDTKPRGPQSVALDFSFVDSKHVYGIPEHASSFSLTSTIKGKEAQSDPYRLYNLDVFEYELNNPMALYGSVPFMISHAPHITTGVFWFNPSETWIDVEHTDSEVNTHWISESGVIDVYFLFGPKPYDIFRQYAKLTGTTALPPMFSLGYHQCKWNYRDEGEVAEVDGGFDTHNTPYDVIWLDIEHTDGKRYFTWDSHNFPTPLEMQKKIAEKGRQMVVIVDPHIKRDSNYAVHSEAQKNDLYVKTHDNREYDGHCWPGSSSWLDYMNPDVRQWWEDRFQYSHYDTSSSNLYVWNDMNEPSVFSGPEVSMHKDALHLHGKVEHRDIHNAYGMYMHMSTSNGLIKRNSGHNKRPFVLSRAFFSGTQRYGAIWTGDNAARWDHLQIAQPMLLSLGVAGITFSGADVGGFFGNPESELVTRWYQAGAFHPFFRGHAHIDSKRREPWLLGEPHLTHIRTAIRMRYSFLPFWYTLYHQNTISGAPVMRPLWADYPTDESIFSEQDSFLVGSDLLVKPVVLAQQKTIDVYFPGQHPWYDFVANTKYGGGSKATIETPLDKIPVFQRGGSIIPKKERARRSTSQMADDPFTLVVALDNNNYARGELYIDDGDSYNFQKGEYLRREFVFSNNVLQSKAIGSGKFPAINTVERIVVYGLARAPQKVTANSQDLSFYFDDNKLIIRKPNFKITDDWTITIA